MLGGEKRAQASYAPEFIAFRCLSLGAVLGSVFKGRRVSSYSLLAKETCATKPE